MHLRRQSGSVWSVEDYSDRVSRESIDMVQGIIPDGEEISRGSVKALCLHTILTLGYYPEGLCLGEDLGLIASTYIEDDSQPSWFSVSLNSQTGKWDWSIESGEDSQFPINLRGSRNEKEMSKLRHDLVAMSMGESSTDVKISTIFGPLLLVEESGKYTPDIHVRIGNCNFIIEIATTMATDPRGGLDAFKEKFSKYKFALEDVDHRDPCILIILVVGRGFVISNFGLDEELVSQLVYYVKVGCRMEEVIEASGMPLIMASSDSDREHMEKTLLKVISSIPIEKRPETLDSPLDITEDFIKSLGEAPDDELVCTYFMRSIKSAVSDVIEQSKVDKDNFDDPRVSKYTTLLSTQESKSSMKPCVGFPLVSLPRQSKFNAEVVIHNICGKEKDLPIIKLWNGAFEGYLNYEVDFLEKLGKHKIEAYCMDPEEQARIEEKNKEFRSKAHRCQISSVLSEHDREALALDGLWGKKYKNSEAKKYKEIFSKLPFNYETDTEDISSFLADTSLCDPCTTGHIELDSINLAFDSMTRLGQNLATANCADEWVNTRLFSALEFISDVAFEVAISMKQNVSANRIILRKMGHYNAYILTLPTKSSEHIFYSIYVPPGSEVDVLCLSPFRVLNELEEGGYYTDFWSMRADTVGNPSTISSAFFGLVAYWACHYKIGSLSPKDFRKHPAALSMLNFNLLVRLENKAKTEEAITLSRYMYMEVLKGSTIVRPDPFRLISKFNTCPRSRLELFVIKRLILAFKRMLEDPPRIVPPPLDDGLEDDKDEGVRNNDVWKNLLNPYSLTMEPSASRLVNLFYIGYSVDKDKVAQRNSDFATIQKAIKKDREFDVGESGRSNGMRDDFESFPKDKQFSINSVKHGVGMMALELTSRFGRGFREKTGEMVVSAMCDHMTEQVATLKASSSEDCKKWEELDTAEESLLSKKYRTKVIVALMKDLDLFQNNVFKRFDVLVDLIEKSSRGVLSDLFKKNQHGGLREIYVLNIRSRIIALFLETSSRVLCKLFDCETMTHPNMKVEVIENHKIKVATRAHKVDREHSDFHCSADKSSWNNNLVMPALSVALFSLLPKYLHGAIQRCLNMWNKRLLKIPEGVLRLLVDGVILSCDTYKEMLDEFDHPKHGLDQDGRPPLFAAPKSSFVRLTTGMMQGILHYTSSLAHVAFLYSSGDLIRAFILRNCPGSEFKISQMCSSDDSATMISIIHPSGASKTEIMKNKIWGEIICQALTKFCSFYCFRNSEKSNVGAPSHIEFNSEFIIGNTIAVPTLKWTTACFGVTESSSLLSRYNTMYNLMSQANAAGLPACNTTLLQIGQCHLAYKLLGYSFSPHFSDYSNMIKMYPHPMYGYFIIDNIYVPGMLGFGYHYWATVKQKGLYNIKMRSVHDGTLGFNPEGGLVENFLLRHGKSERYKRMMAEMGDGVDISELREEINSKAECLYRPSRCAEDAKVKLIAKALLPGTAESLSRGVQFIQSLHSSAYSLYSFCFTRYESCLIGTEREKTSEKMSLLGALKRAIDERNGPVQEHLESSEMAAFPNCDRYRAYRTVLEPFKDARLKRVRPMRSKKTTMYLPHATSHIPVPLYDICKDKWVGIRHKHSRLLAEKCWLEYRELMPWLQESLAETLEQSPFSDHMELHNFVSTAHKSHRKFIRVGPAIRSTYPESQISLVARRTHMEDHILILGQEKTSFYRSFRNRRNAMSLALEIPLDGPRTKAVGRVVKDHPISVNELTHMKDKSLRESTLNVITAKLEGYPDAAITKMVMELGGGLLITWTTEQKKVTDVHEESRKVSSRWVGHGKLVLCNDHVLVNVIVKDKEITMMETNDERAARRFFGAIRTAMHSQNLVPGKFSVSADAFYTDKEICKTGPGVPLVEIKESYMTAMPSLQDIRYNIKISQGEIRLMQEGTCIEPSTVLCYKVMKHELDPLYEVSVEEDVWKAWYKQCSLDKEVAKLMIKESYERIVGERATCSRETDSYKESMKLMTFIKDSLGNRLRGLGHLSGTSMARGDQGDEDLAQTEISRVRSSLLDAFEKALDEDALNYDKSSRVGVEQLVQSALIQQMQYHKDGLEENPQVAEAMEMGGHEDMMEGTLCTPIFSEYMSLFTGTRTLVDYTSARLSNMYSVLSFWDCLIQEAVSVNSRAWTYLSKGEVVPGLSISQPLIFFLTGSTKASGMRRAGITSDERLVYLAKKAVYDDSMAKFSKARSSRSAMTEIQRLKDRLGKMMELDEELDCVMTKQELITKVMKCFDDIESDSESRCMVKPLVDLGGQAVSETGSVKLARWVDEVDSDVLAPPVIPKPDMATYDNVNSELTINEMELLYKLARYKLNASHWEENISPMIFQMRTGEGPLRLNINDIHLVPIHIGPVESDAEGGHWMSAVSGMSQGLIEVYDGLNSDSNLEVAYEQLSNIFVGLRREQVVRINIDQQPPQSCGHLCMLQATHRLLDKHVYSYTKQELSMWVLSCLLMEDIRVFGE
nr:MAG: putative RNA-dependent RNA polymerase [Hanko phenui-like virus 1]